MWGVYYTFRHKLHMKRLQSESAPLDPPNASALSRGHFIEICDKHSRFSISRIGNKFDLEE